MHFVDKSKVDKTVIDRLAEFDKKESLKWGRYFTTNPRPNAPRSHWTDDEIRLPLVEIFQKNCGYCGKYTNNTTTEINTKQTFSGSVDHYIPKSIDYEKIYDWKNYIWACSDCNFKKSDYYNVNAMILNPCDKNDCESLYFIGGTCVYELISDSDELLKERFRVTVLHTLINNDDHIKQIRKEVRTLKLRFDNIKNEYIFNQLGIKNDYQEVVQHIRADIAVSPFKLLIRDVIFPRYIEENPDFPLTINDLGIY